MTKKITLYNSRAAKNDPPENLQGHITWLQAMLESIPEEFRCSGVVELHVDEYHMEYEVIYERPETAEEAEVRERNERSRREKMQQQELATLAALKAKYPTC